MRISGSILVLAILVSPVGSQTLAQQSDSNGFDKVFQSSFAKARDVIYFMRPSAARKSTFMYH